VQALHGARAARGVTIAYALNVYTRNITQLNSTQIVLQALQELAPRVGFSMLAPLLAGIFSILFNFLCIFFCVFFLFLGMGVFLRKRGALITFSYFSYLFLSMKKWKQV
jgi:uncharacterized protein YacL